MLLGLCSVRLSVADSFSFRSFFFFQAEDGIRDDLVTGVQTCALPISVHQVNRASDRLDPVDDPAEILACRVRVAGVQAEADVAVARVANDVPEPGQVLDRKSVV